MSIRRIGPILLTLALSVLASETAPAGGDTPGGQDHPALGRIPGAVIVDQSVADYDTLVYPVESERHKVTRVAEREGKLTRTIYLLPAGKSPSTAQAIYRKRLKELGLKILYRCRNERIGFYMALVQQTDDDYWTRGNAPRKLHCVVAEGELQGRPAVVAAYSYEAIYSRTPDGRKGWLPTLRLYILEQAALDARLEVVTAEKMAEALRSDGHIALYNVLFDHDSDRLKPEARTELTEIARFLREHPQIRVYVVGHTDNTGSYDYNLRLSQRRAAAVVKALEEKHGIAPDRLKDVGVGPVAPVASNATEQGRAKNRRVELVQR